MNKHTPGPWKWQDWTFYGDADDGPNKQTLVGPKREPRDYGPEHVRIISFEDPPENPDDLVLIAESPTMFALLERLVVEFSGNGTGLGLQETMTEVERLIRRVNEAQ